MDCRLQIMYSDPSVLIGSGRHDEYQTNKYKNNQNASSTEFHEFQSNPVLRCDCRAKSQDTMGQGFRVVLGADWLEVG